MEEEISQKQLRRARGSETSPATAGLSSLVQQEPSLQSSQTAVKTNVTGLTVGSYVMLLEVRDNSGNTATDQMEIKVSQDTNQPPLSDPGPNLKLVLPTNTAVLDGSGSSDDLAVEKWEWSRDQDSLAGGNVVGNWSSSKLVVANLLPGTYSFSLQVRATLAI